ncbi:Transposase DDE domain protein [Acinetobacter celticus]
MLKSYKYMQFRSTNNVSDSQVLGNLLNQISPDGQIDSVYTMGFITKNIAGKSFQID